VFTSPEQTKNELRQFALSGAYDVSDVVNVTAQIYRRESDRDGLNGDIYEGFDDFTKDDDFIIDPARPPSDRIIARNGANQNNRVGGVTDGAGIIDGTPIGLLTPIRLMQDTNGAALQLNWNHPGHKFMIGASLDRADSAYSMHQRLGLIDASHQVYLAPESIAPEYYAASHDIPGNNFDGTSTTQSLYLNETWSPLRTVHVTLAGRYNRTKVESALFVRSAAADLHEIRTSSPILDQLVNQMTLTSETYRYSSFNPQLGINWLPVPNLNLYGNLSRGARVPSVVELGCAFDGTPVDISVGGAPRTAPRSLVGPSCNLPTTLSGDPYLPQIRSTSAELGARGRLFRRWEWDVSAFGTRLDDDIYFVGVGDGKSYFDTIGRTKRLGAEIGLSGSFGPVDVRLGYSYTEATFDSTFYTVSPHNSTADFDQNSQAPTNRPELGDFITLPTPNAFANNGRGTYHMIRIDPGARLPGVPEYNYNGRFTFRATRTLRFGLGAIAHSGTFVRGNENNLHRPLGTDQETGLYFCFAGTGCANTGLQQAFVRRGRPFTNEGRQDGFVIFNLDANLLVTPGLSLFARVNNVLDEEYVTAGRLGVNPFSPPVNGAIGSSGWNYNSSEWQNSTFVGPGAPRGFWLGFRYERTE
jgi:outer membrane receptor protein involved in Fe transport